MMTMMMKTGLNQPINCKCEADALFVSLSTASVRRMHCLSRSKLRATVCPTSCDFALPFSAAATCDLGCVCEHIGPTGS